MGMLALLSDKLRLRFEGDVPAIVSGQREDSGPVKLVGVLLSETTRVMAWRWMPDPQPWVISGGPGLRFPKLTFDIERAGVPDRLLVGGIMGDGRAVQWGVFVVTEYDPTPGGLSRGMVYGLDLTLKILRWDS